MKKIITLIILLLLSSDIYPQSGWNQQTLPVSGTILDMQFVNAQTGWITLGNPFNFLKTTDGGKNWEIIYSNSPQFGYFQFFNEDTGYALGRDVNFNGMISKTINGGLNWNVLQLTAKGYTALSFINPDTGWIGAFTDDNVQILRTTNGCQSFDIQLSSLGSGQIDLLQFTNENYNGNHYGWFLRSGFMSKTTNSGLSWSALTSVINGNNGNFNSLFFLNKDTGWVGFDLSIGDNKIYRTNSGGTNWIEQNENTQGVRDIFFVNEFTGWAGYTLFKMFATSNGGNVWGTQTSPIVSNLILSFNNELIGWAGDRFLVHSIDGGGLITFIGIDPLNTEIPSNFILKQNYPNPFNPQTTIEFSIKQNSNVSLILFDILGKEILKIYNNENLNTGNYKAVLDFSKDNLSSGTYFYKLIVYDINSKQIFLETKKLTYIK